MGIYERAKNILKLHGNYSRELGKEGAEAGEDKDLITLRSFEIGLIEGGLYSVLLYYIAGNVLNKSPLPLFITMALTGTARAMWARRAYGSTK